VTIPQTDGAARTPEGIRAVVKTYRDSTAQMVGQFRPTARGIDKVQHRQARWADRLAEYMLRIADEMEHMQALLDQQGEVIRQGDKVWVVSCACGQSWMMPRDSTVEERHATLTRHQREKHGIDPATTEGTE
jgi:hypothetical protein